MLVRPIKLRIKSSFDENATNFYPPALDTCINRPRFDLATELIAKSQQMRRLHTSKVRELTPTSKSTVSKQLSSMCDAQISTTFSDIEDEGPNLPGFSNPMLISVTRSRPKTLKVKEIPGSLRITAPASPIHRTLASPLRRSPLKSNVVTTKLKDLKQALMQKLASPKRKRPQSSKQSRPDNYFLQKPKRRLSMYGRRGSSGNWLTPKFSEGESDLNASTRIFDISQVIRITSGIFS